MTQGTQRNSGALKGGGSRLRAKKELGQHFLVSSSVLARIRKTCESFLPEAQGILEIGPGTGALTGQLRSLGLQLLAVEADRKLARLLEEQFPDVRVVCGDARQTDFKSLTSKSGSSRWLVAGNLPYYAGTDILKRILCEPELAVAVVVMLQREVARKFCAQAGDEAYGVLGAWTSVWWEPSMEFTVRPGAFRPQPKVMSSVCVFRPKRRPLLAEEEMAGFQVFLARAFAHPRKTLKHNLGGHAAPDNPSARPANLSTEAYVRLYLEICGRK